MPNYNKGDANKNSIIFINYLKKTVKNKLKLKKYWFIYTVTLIKNILYKSPKHIKNKRISKCRKRYIIVASKLFLAIK